MVMDETATRETPTEAQVKNDLMNELLGASGDYAGTQVVYRPGEPYGVRKRNGDAEPLGRRFRRLVREAMVDDQIQALIRQRVVAELSGQTEGCPVTTTMMKIAAAQPSGNRGVVRPEGPRVVMPAIHVHLNNLTDEELRLFAERGMRPERLKLGPAGDDSEEGRAED